MLKSPMPEHDVPYPIAVTIAGSDSSGGAGIQADLKTFSALGVYGASVIVALTAQNTRGVTAIHPVPPAFVAEQIDAVFTDLDVAAVKIGMLGNAELIETVADGVSRHGARNIVLDPVMVAATGARLLEESAIVAVRDRLMPLTNLVTPNLMEAAALLDAPLALEEREMAVQAERLRSYGARAVLIKGGHGQGPNSVDVFAAKERARHFTSPRIDTMNTHGTGCTLSSAIAAGLAKGLPLEDAIEMAKRFVTEAIRCSGELAVGQGYGPVHHFHALWPAAAQQ
ncbi:bifunctional hydroxymethylpyrimidine kinase/phosphomethylpyrimidine kinase [Agaricicola taiwanensis]|nr:bifunctional hydroxymethylpyrimidine kinase/phosphomethylpyrimidine kinase [Agaricicola taiwanensis]